MAKLTAQAPILMVKDFQQSVIYWQEALGFKAQIWGEPSDFAILRRDNCFMMISDLKGEEPNQPNWKITDNMWNAYFWVDDVDAVHADCLAADIEVTFAPADMSWGVRECHVRHPDGHVFRLSRSLPPAQAK